MHIGVEHMRDYQPPTPKGAGLHDNMPADPSGQYLFN
jgi:hypothetical protein